MSDTQTGWSPASRVRRSVLLPEALDHQVAVMAKSQRSTPSAVMAKAVGDAVQAGITAAMEQLAKVNSDQMVRRVLVLDRQVNRILEERLAAANIELSDLVANLAKNMVANSNASLNGYHAGGDGSLNGNGHHPGRE